MYFIVMFTYSYCYVVLLCVFCFIVLLYVLLMCKCVLYYCHRVFNPIAVNKYIISYIKVARLSALSTGRLSPKNIFLVLICVKRLIRPWDHSMSGKIMSTKISSDTIGNRTRDPQACSEVPQPNASTSAPNRLCNIHNVFSKPIERVKLYKKGKTVKQFHYRPEEAQRFPGI